MKNRQRLSARTLWGLGLLGVGMALAWKGGAFGAERENTRANAEFRLKETEVFDTTSKSGLTYRIFIARPLDEAPPDGFPVLYVLDANACFATVVESHRLQSRRPTETGVAPGVIVGIGYPTEAPFDPVRRTYDLTTPASPEKLPPTRIPGGWPRSGGADQFLTFIEEELKPMIEEKFPIHPARQAMVGHSLGGLFVLHALFSRPQAFQFYIAASPSAWWNDYSLLRESTRFVARLESLNLPVHLLITVGEAELRDDAGPAAALPPTPAKEAFGDLRKFHQRLAAHQSPNFSTQYREFAGEHHSSSLFLSLNSALRFGLAHAASRPVAPERSGGQEK